MTSGGQCVMTSGTALMLLWSASSWDMHILEVSEYSCYFLYACLSCTLSLYVQMVELTAMLTLALAVDQSFWMMFSVPQAPGGY